MKRLHRDASRAALLGLSCCTLLACPGPSGQPCSVRDNGDGTATISCSDGTSVVVRNGTDGTNGTSCTVSANPDAGTKTITCTDGTSVTVIDGTNGVDANAVVDFSTLTTVELAATELSVTVLGVTGAAKPVVTFVVRDGKGKGVKGIPPANFSGISLLQLARGDTAAGGNGLNNDTWVSLITNCGTCTASTETAGAASLLDQGTGAYVYTFQKDVTAIPGIAFDASAPHKLGLRLAASGNPFRPVDSVYEYVPATGANVTGQNDKVTTASCLQCHMQWRANAQNAGGTVPFHNGQRYEAQYCVVCHNDQRKYSGSSPSGNPVIAEPTIDALGNMTPPAGRTNIPVLRGQAVINLPVFVHKIHRGRDLFLKGNYAGLGTEMNEITFPQSAANCSTCHRDAALADNWKNKPSRRACGSCHDQVDFTTGTGHLAGPFADDSLCGNCHTPSLVATAHIPIAPIDPRNIYSTPVGGSANTNAASLGNASNPPPGAVVFTYAMPDAGVIGVPGDGGVNAQVKFKLMDGTGSVVFNTFDAGVTELMDNFVGSPSVYCAFSMPQDGIAAPADFNASVSGYLKNIWRNAATGSGAGNMIGPDPNGFYTVTLTGVTIPPSARLLTCGVGYTYNLTSAQPLTQTNVSGYPYDPATKVGGLSIPPANIWQVAVGYAGRRGATSNRTATGTGLIVNPTKCNSCHNTLGVSPTFHAGQRNDGPSCSWCHTQNRTSSGWSAGSESFVHAIHGAGKRTVPFNWHALSDDEGFYGITFPGRPQQCEGCHNPGYYDFSASWYTTAGNVGTRLPQTVATGTYNGLPTLPDGGVNTNLWALSPYVIADNVYSYGSGYSFNAGTQVITEAAPTTLVNSPITNACFGCHDATDSVWHYRANGGQVYEPRGAQPYVNKEQCLICHGPGKIAAIKTVHYQ